MGKPWLNDWCTDWFRGDVLKWFLYPAVARHNVELSPAGKGWDAFTSSPQQVLGTYSPVGKTVESPPFRIIFEFKASFSAGKSQRHVGPVTINVASIWITIDGGPTKRLLNMVTNVALRSVVEPNDHSSEVVGSSCLLDETQITQPFPLVKLFFGATVLPRGWFLSPKHHSSPLQIMMRGRVLYTLW